LQIGIISNGVAEALGCRAQMAVQRVTPPVVNDRNVTSRVQRAARALLPDSDPDTSGYLTMGAEDMAFMQEKVPGCYFFVGSSNRERHLDFGHHHPKFDFDEEAMISATALMAAAAIELLQA
jgi:metal-dependent amidase/aminoacylase/carboxypeptidase family protein